MGPSSVQSTIAEATIAASAVRLEGRRLAQRVSAQRAIRPGPMRKSASCSTTMAPRYARATPAVNATSVAVYPLPGAGSAARQRRQPLVERPAQAVIGQLVVGRVTLREDGDAGAPPQRELGQTGHRMHLERAAAAEQQVALLHQLDGALDGVLGKQLAEQHHAGLERRAAAAAGDALVLEAALELGPL